MTHRAGYFAPVADNTPDAFTFNAVGNASLNTLYSSNSITLSGLGGSGANLSVSGGSVSINGGGNVTSGTVFNGDTLVAKVTTSGTYGGVSTVTVTVGTYQTNYVVTNAVRTFAGFNSAVINTGAAANGSWYSFSGRVFTATNSTQMWAFNDANTLVPKDGSWYYWESNNSGSSYGQLVGKNSGGTYIVYNPNTKRVACQWNGSQYVYKTYAEGSTTAASTVNVPATTLTVYAAVSTQGITSSTINLTSAQFRGPMPTDVSAIALFDSA